MHYQLTTTQSIFFQRQTSSRLPVFSTLYNWKFREEEGWFFSFSLMIISPILHKSQAKWKKTGEKGFFLSLISKYHSLHSSHTFVYSQMCSEISPFFSEKCVTKITSKKSSHPCSTLFTLMIIFTAFFIMGIMDERKSWTIVCSQEVKYFILN